MSRVLKFQLHESRGIPVLTATAFAAKKEPTDLKILVGGLPRGTFGMDYLAQRTGLSRSVVVFKVNRFKNAQTLLEMFESVGFSVQNKKNAFEFAKQNQYYHLSPSAYADETLAFVQICLGQDPQFAGLKPTVIGHSFGGFTLLVRLHEMDTAGLLTRLATAKGQITLLCPMILHRDRDLEEKSESKKEFRAAFKDIQSTRIYSDVVSSPLAVSGTLQELDKIWQSPARISEKRVPVSVVVSTLDEECGIKNKVELVRKLREKGLDAKLVLLVQDPRNLNLGLILHARDSSLEIDPQLGGSVEAVTLRKSALGKARGTYAEQSIHNLYPDLLVRLGHSELI